MAVRRSPLRTRRGDRVPSRVDSRSPADPFPPVRRHGRPTFFSAGDEIPPLFSAARQPTARPGTCIKPSARTRNKTPAPSPPALPPPAPSPPPALSPPVSALPFFLPVFPPLRFSLPSVSPSPFSSSDHDPALPFRKSLLCMLPGEAAAAGDRGRVRQDTTTFRDRSPLRSPPPARLPKRRSREAATRGRGGNHSPRLPFLSSCLSCLSSLPAFPLFLPFLPFLSSALT